MVNHIAAQEMRLVLRNQSEVKRGEHHLGSAFSVAYADQNERDHAALKRAVRDGKVEGVFEEVR